MKVNRIPKATTAEKAHIRGLKRRSVFDLVDAVWARVLAEDEYPEPVQRFHRLERRIVHIRLSLVVKRRLEALSRAHGLAAEELARHRMEQALSRDTG